jgi:F0F1-type ATP synthase assembly protein I
MKLFVPPPRANRAPKSLSDGSPDTLGRGMDVALTLGVFLVLGWLLDNWLGTTPLFMISLTILAAVGQFLRMKYVYDAEMERLEGERMAGRNAKRSTSGTGFEDAA